MMEQIMILNRDNSRREKHLWMEIKLNHMQDKTKFFFLQKLHSIPILLYGSESRCLNKPSTFHTKSLGRILSLWIYWPKTIPNQDLFNRCQQEDITTKNRQKTRWNWLGHLLKETRTTLSEKKVLALFGTPEGKRRTRSLMVTWGRTMAA